MPYQPNKGNYVEVRGEGHVANHTMIYMMAALLLGMMLRFLFDKIVKWFLQTKTITVLRQECGVQTMQWHPAISVTLYGECYHDTDCQITKRGGRVQQKRPCEYCMHSISLNFSP